jgi:hypothetical protein
MESFMEVGQGPNVGCSAKGKKNTSKLSRSFNPTAEQNVSRCGTQNIRLFPQRLKSINKVFETYIVGDSGYGYYNFSNFLIFPL